MDNAKMVDMVTRVPKLTNKLNFMKTTTGNNAAFRTRFAALTLLPLLLTLDLNGGLSNFGFTRA